MSAPTCLFVSPHLDDAALSCGGTIRRLASAGWRVVVATVATADAPADLPLGPLMLRCHRHWGRMEAPFAARCREDRRAMHILGAEPVHLGLLDAIYRAGSDGRPYYPDDVLDIPIPEQDWSDSNTRVRERLEAAIRDVGVAPSHIFLPLGVAGHVDHHLTRHAAETLGMQAVHIYYEEFPYATAPGRHAVDEGWRSALVPLDGAELEARREAIACYESATAFLFPSRAQTALEIVQARLPFLWRVPAWRPDPRASLRRMERELGDYVARVGGERYWFPAGEPGRLPL